MPVNVKSFSRIAGNIRIMPISGISIFDNLTDPLTVNLTNIFRAENESNISVDPIKTPLSKGGYLTLGYNVSATIYISYNVWDENGIINELEKYINATAIEKRPQIMLLLGNRQPYSGSAPEVINANGGMCIDLKRNCTLSYKVETVEFRPRLQIFIEGSFKASKNEVYF